MAREATILAYTAEEARALYELDEAYNALYDAFHALQDRLHARYAPAERDEWWPLLSTVDVNVGAVMILTQAAIHARLCRILPHLADIAALVCYPEIMHTPDHLAETGAPHPFTHPPVQKRDEG